MKKLKNLNRILLLLVTVFAAISFWTCSRSSSDSITDINENEGLAKITVANVDSVIDILLPATSGGISYDFNVDGTAGATAADFTLTVNKTGEGAILHSVDFSLPLADVDASPGETGSGSITTSIYQGTNTVTIPFEWDSVSPQSETAVNLTFTHPPGINDWSAIPGPGATAGTDVSIQADVTFYGSTPGVEVQFVSSGTLIGSPASLTNAGSVWIGTISAESGADALRLTATDDEGTTSSDAQYVVP